jgi:hypothetical protein
MKGIMRLTTLLQIAGLLHLGLMAAGLTMPQTVNLKGHLQTLPPFIRNLYWVYYSFIGLCLLGFGTLTFFFAAQLAAGDSLARAVCFFLTAFWSVRLFAAAFVFNVRPYLTHWLYKAGYQATNAVFVYLVVIYALATLKGGGL